MEIFLKREVIKIGKKDGKWVKYRENGEVDVTTIYKNGRLIEQIWG